jgi:hypothetical protein
MMTAGIMAGVGALGSLGGSLIQSGAASSAASTQAQSDANALALQKQMFGTAQSAVNPYITAGNSVLPTLQSLLTPGASQTATLSKLPGLQFQQQYGDLTTTNQLAAQGLGGSGGPLGMALSNYNQGLASTSYNNYVSQLQGFAGMGSQAAQSLASGAIQSGNAQAATTQAQSSALASGTLGSANALASGLTGATSSASNALLLSSLLGSNGSSLSGLFGNQSSGNVAAGLGSAG